MYGNPIPWKKTELTPNLGGFASTDDMRPGLGYTGLMNLQNFVKNGGVFVGADDSAKLCRGDRVHAWRVGANFDASAGHRRRFENAHG
jgi:hypothetical protein